MKLLKIAIAAVFALGASSAYAFHSGGVAECGGCHSMHSAQSTDRNLLVAADQSSTCFSCHMNAADTGPSSYHVGSYQTNMTASGGGYPLQRSPGGDFSWLLITKSSTVRGSVENYYGYKNGHNIVASAQGFVADPANATAPGGTMPSASLSCVSCHDQHGQARRLAGDVIQSGGSATGLPIANSGSYNTSNDPQANYAVGIYRLLRVTGGFGGFPGAPVAVAPATYNKQEDGAASQVRVAYGTGAIGTGNASWGAWCGSCHPGMLSSSASTDHKHPVDVDLGGFGGSTGNYNVYVKSGWTNGAQATAFTSLVPFATKGAGYTSYASLKPLAAQVTNRAGPDTTDQVMCLSCHRAHASAFPEMTRFGLDNEFVTDAAGAYRNILGRDATGMQASYNGRDASNILVGASVSTVYAQRVLCNKCHLKD